MSKVIKPARQRKPTAWRVFAKDFPEIAEALDARIKLVIRRCVLPKRRS